MKNANRLFFKSLQISTLSLLISGIPSVHSSFAAATVHPVASQIEKKELEKIDQGTEEERKEETEALTKMQERIERVTLQFVENTSAYLRAKLPLTSPMRAKNLPQVATPFSCTFGDGTRFMTQISGTGSTNASSRLDMDVTIEAGDGGPQSSPLKIQLTLAQAPSETSTIQYIGPCEKDGAPFRSAPLLAQVRQLPSGVFFILPESMSSLEDLGLAKSDDSSETFFNAFNHYIDQFEFAGQSKTYSMSGFGVCHFESQDEKTKQAVESEIREHDEALYNEGK